MTATFESRCKAQALGLGFDLVGIASLGPVATHGAFLTWIAEQRHGTMEYLARGAELRADTTRPEPGMRSAIVVALDYGGRAPDGPVARYARGADYHRVMWDKLDALLAWMRTEYGESLRGRAYVDTGPILERDLARRAGLGWFGKNTMLLNPELGSFFFLGALFVDAQLAPDAPFDAEHCGSCTRCLDACPTNALVAPGVLDARRCISYLTIEHRGEIADELQSAVGAHLYGCDICQDVCPWNVKFAREVHEPAFASTPPVAREDGALLDARTLATRLLDMDESEYRSTFQHSAMKRAKLEGLTRNARYVLRNLATMLALAAFSPAVAGDAHAQAAPPNPPAPRAPQPDSTRVDSLRPFVVSSTRGRRRVEDEPLRVETLAGEEIEEKLLMTPGDLTMLLNETTGLRVQPTSPSIGAANLRVQGLRGRYTQLLVDGLPLHGGQSGGLGLLQVPPMDLAGVEVIKGVSSALYGASAIGGVVNLLSRFPEHEPVREFLVNRTSLGGSDVVGFASGEVDNGWGYTVLTGAHQQRRIDRDDDGWTDLPSYQRYVVRPRVHWRSSSGHTAMLTVGGTSESRRGGTEPGALTPDGGSFREEVDTERADVGAVSRWLFGSTIVVARGAVTSQRHAHRFGSTIEHDRHSTAFVEVSANGVGLGGSWVIGGALQNDAYRHRELNAFDYTFDVPSLFAQHTVDVRPNIAVTASGRLDSHRAYGLHFSPRLAILWRLTDVWSVRSSAGTGFFAPTPFVEEVEAVGLSQLNPLDDLRAERAASASIDVGGSLGESEVQFSVFGARITRPVVARESSTDSLRIDLSNATEPFRTIGAELLLRRHVGPLHLTASYTFVRAREASEDLTSTRTAPLTPASTAGVVAVWEIEERGRIGVEVYFTGAQQTPDDPSHSTSPSYTHIGVLAERRFGPVRVFVNAENLLDVRQTDRSSLVRPSRGLGGRWTTDLWGPLDGRVANVGVRF